MLSYCELFFFSNIKIQDLHKHSNIVSPFKQTLKFHFADHTIIDFAQALLAVYERIRNVMNNWCLVGRGSWSLSLSVSCAQCRLCHGIMDSVCWGRRSSLTDI